MLAFLPIEFWLLMLAFGFLIAVLMVAMATGKRRRQRAEAASVRFVPHWHLLVLLGAAVVVIIGAILVPVVAGLVHR